MLHVWGGDGCALYTSLSVCASVSSRHAAHRLPPPQVLSPSALLGTWPPLRSTPTNDRANSSSSSSSRGTATTSVASGAVGDANRSSSSSSLDSVRPRYDFAPAWRLDWAACIRQVVAQLQPPPTVLVLNMGMWGPTSNETFYRELARAAREVVPRVIWKTTTRMRDAGPTKWLRTDLVARRVFGEVRQLAMSNLPHACAWSCFTCDLPHACMRHVVVFYL